MGPFKLVTRRNTGGQIVDANYAFGSVYIKAHKVSVATLTVADTAESPIEEMPQGALIGLSFAFGIDYDMWEHDLIVITKPSELKISNPTCESLDTDNTDDVIVNNLCTTNATSCDLACEVSNNDIYIYGFNKSLKYASAVLNAKISVNSFVLPSANWQGSQMNWKLQTRRFGTNTVYKEYTGIGPSTLKRIIESSITMSSAAHRGLVNTKIFNGMSLYMDFTFTTSSAIPKDGILKATFSNIVLVAFPDDAGTQCISDRGTQCTASSPDLSLIHI